MAYQFHFDEEKCTGCLACHTACISSHFDYWEDAESFRTIQRFVKTEEGFQKNISPGCTHCGACMKVCPEGAVFKDKATGFILTDREKCTGCRVCESECSLHVIRFDREEKMAKCDGCIQIIEQGKEPLCVKNCYAGAIVLEER
ncbi:MAG: 4Fe-4S dicluster domain-containing protein [Muricomes sp.]